MPNGSLRSVLLLPALGLAAVAFASAAQAQFGPDPMNPATMIQNGTGAAPMPKMGPARPAPPPALPGATSRADTVAPATQPALDMTPNDALFDAINRGDIAAARDALSRGAVLTARNVLGMTPMELAVDLGRNDICFLLLSYRDTDTPKGPPVKQAVAVAAPVQKAAAPKPADRRAVMPVTAVGPAAPEAPRLFAGDGGTPVPSAGFLGFDASRPSQ